MNQYVVVCLMIVVIHNTLPQNIIPGGSVVLKKSSTKFTNDVNHTAHGSLTQPSPP